MSAAMNALARRIQMMVARGVLRRTDDAPQWPELQVELLEDETHEGVEHVLPYGLATHPRPGAEAVVIAPGGLRSHGLVIAVGDRRYRMRLAEGEVAVHDDQGQAVHLTRDGILVTSPLGVTIDTDGDLALSAAGDLSIAAQGALSIETGDTLRVEAAGAATIDVASLTVTASGAMAFNGDDIAIGNGAANGAARRLDPIDDSNDRISGGSGRVRIG